MTSTERRKLLPSIGKFFRIAVNLAAILGVALSAKEVYDAYADRTISLPFSTIDECRFGDLWDMRSEGALTKSVRFGQHALGLAICDSRDPIEVSRPEVAAKVVDMFPGCLRLDKGEQTLYMVLNSAAVCRVPNPSIRGPWFFCDGMHPSALKVSESNVVGTADKLSLCQDSFFHEENRPGPRLAD